ncbi:MAG: MGMT family protein [Desulfurococcales archaeon]|nr:MGMT family protein [Desulfurococcales archaeon]
MDKRSLAYTLLQLIPPGYVTTYASLARVLGTSPRAVGRLMASNPDPVIVPCHRVVKSNLDLGGYSMGGPMVKRRLLELEGVEFDSRGRVKRRHVILIDKLLLEG